MVGRPDSLQTEPNLHDRMWELDGFGDYMKHSFHFQFIVLRRGITFTQMARNLEMHSYRESQNVHRRRNLFKDEMYVYICTYMVVMVTVLRSSLKVNHNMTTVIHLSRFIGYFQCLFCFPLFCLYMLNGVMCSAFMQSSD